MTSPPSPACGDTCSPSRCGSRAGIGVNRACVACGNTDTSAASTRTVRRTVPPASYTSRSTGPSLHRPQCSAVWRSITDDGPTTTSSSRMPGPSVTPGSRWTASPPWATETRRVTVWPSKQRCGSTVVDVSTRWAYARGSASASSTSGAAASANSHARPVRSAADSATTATVSRRSVRSPGRGPPGGGGGGWTGEVRPSRTRTTAAPGRGTGAGAVTTARRPYAASSVCRRCRRSRAARRPWTSRAPTTPAAATPGGPARAPRGS